MWLLDDLRFCQAGTVDLVNQCHGHCSPSSLKVCCGDRNSCLSVVIWTPTLSSIRDEPCSLVLPASWVWLSTMLRSSRFSVSHSLHSSFLASVSAVSFPSALLSWPHSVVIGDACLPQASGDHLSLFLPRVSLIHHSGRE